MTVRKAMQLACLALDEDLSNGAMPDSKGQVDKYFLFYNFFISNEEFLR